MEKSMKKYIKNAKVWTADRKRPWASEILVEDDKIREIGDDLKLSCEKTDVIDAEGRMIIPAFIDSHIHPIAAAKSLWCLLLEQRDYESFEEIMGIVKDYCEEHPKEEMPYQYVYTCPSELMDAENVDRYLIDQFVSDRPIIVCDSSFHRCVCNSIMLELMEISKSTPYNTESSLNYERFEDGTPNGIISERIHEFNGDIEKMFDKLGWWPPSEEDPETIKPLFDIMTEFGLTCLHDGFAESEKALIGVQKLEKQGDLHHYFHTMPIIDVYNGKEVKENAEAAFATAIEWGKKYNSHFITCDSVKLFLDGTNEIGTSAVLEPFEGTDDNYGRINATEEELTYILERINQEGLSIQIHLVGDRAFRVALNAFWAAVESEKQAGREYESRVTLLHCELTKPEDRKRTVHPKLFINTSPTFNAGVFGDEAKQYLGDERFDSMFVFNDMIEMGTTVNCSADIVDEEGIPFANPLFVIEAGRRRTLTDDEHIRPRAEEKMSVEDLLYGYTINNAKGIGREDTIGSLEPGKLANLCILSDNLFEIPPDMIGQVKVEKLMFEGEFLY